ncbi:DUF2199 domain-containing protein [Domibacillus sp. 8LH]|uniref:DUF2199 domain-containing protein n=1 Tax=Domibacillus sp. 8LH TaxID=3073900 RepID=UPI0031708EF9
MTKIGGYTRSCCGISHEELPTSYGNPAPVYYYDAEPEEREDRFELDDDLCILDNEHSFIRGCLEIPVIGTDEHLIGGAWVSLSKTNFNTVENFWDEQESLEPMIGWFSTALPCYPDTVNLKARIHFRSDGKRFTYEFEIKLLLNLIKSFLIPAKELFISHNIKAYISGVEISSWSVYTYLDRKIKVTYT